MNKNFKSKFFGGVIFCFFLGLDLSSEPHSALETNQVNGVASTIPPAFKLAGRKALGDLYFRLFYSSGCDYQAEAYNDNFKKLSGLMGAFQKRFSSNFLEDNNELFFQWAIRWCGRVTQGIRAEKRTDFQEESESNTGTQCYDHWNKFIDSENYQDFVQSIKDADFQKASELLSSQMEILQTTVDSKLCYEDLETPFAVSGDYKKKFSKTIALEAPEWNIEKLNSKLENIDISTHVQTQGSVDGSKRLQTIHPKGQIDALFSSIDKKDEQDCRAPVKVYQSVYKKTVSKGKIPEGLFRGTLLTYTRGLCQHLLRQSGFKAEKKSLVDEMLAAPAGQMASIQSINGVNFKSAVAAAERQGIKNQDVLKRYGNKKEWHSLSSENSYVANAIRLYSLMLPLAMLESDGRIDEGKDQKTSNKNETAEAGLYQVSYNSTHAPYWVAMKEVYASLQDKYGVKGQGRAEMLKNPKCLTSVFSGGITASSNNANVGSEQNASRFQTIMKACPALATEYMLALSRVGVKNNLPLRDEHAKPKLACVKIFHGIKKNLAASPESCGAFL